jgi:hypothetical protein
MSGLNTKIDIRTHGGLNGSEKDDEPEFLLTVMRASGPLQTWIWHLLSSTATHRGDADGCGDSKVRERFEMLYDSFASRGLFYVHFLRIKSILQIKYLCYK